MSKDKPEVGDVWLNEANFNVNVFAVSVNICAFYVFNNNIWAGEFTKEEFLKTHTYLGKSKANIKDLFKTENEE